MIAGPYKVVRHPLYAAEALTILGMVIANWSIPVVILWLVWIGLQYCRILNEEGVLRAAFPEYETYANEVPRLVPNFLFAIGNGWTR